MKLLLFFILPLSLFLASCSSTPATRIERNPAVFEKLSTKHQDLVRQGKIDQGMTKPAVFLAMGNPNTKTVGEQDGKSFERWNYNVMVPVYSHGFTPYYGYGWGRYGRRGRCGAGVVIHPSVHYVPRHGASVEFRKGKVTGWNRVKRNY